MEGLKETTEVTERAKVSSAIVTVWSASFWCLANVVVVVVDGQHVYDDQVSLQRGAHYGDPQWIFHGVEEEGGMNGEGVDDRTHVASERKITRARPLELGMCRSVMCLYLYTSHGVGLCINRPTRLESNK